jgi:hypothetical protein
MRARVAILLLAVLAVPVSAPLARAADETSGFRNSVLAQEEEAETETGGGQGTEAETGAGEGETQQAPTEPGPPWTFQMARIGGLLVILLLGGIGWWYYRLIIKRQRGEI